MSTTHAGAKYVSVVLQPVETENGRLKRRRAPSRPALRYPFEFYSVTLTDQ